MTPFAGRASGAREIGFAIIAMTLTLAAVYAPVAFAHRAHRPAVPGIRADAGRRGAGVGLRGADADADDVLQAAAARAKHGRVYDCCERCFVAWRAATDAAAPAGLRRGCWSCAGAGRVGVAAAACCSCRSSRNWRRSRTAGVIIGIGHGARRLDPRVHRPLLRAHGSRCTASIPRSSATSRSSAFPTCRTATWFCALKDWDERERKQQEIGAKLRPEVHGAPGRHRLRGQPAVAGPGRRERSRSRFVIQTGRPTKDLSACRPHAGRDAQEPGHQRRQRPEAEQAAAGHRRQPRQGGRRRVAVDIVGRTLETLLGGRQVTRFKRDGEQYDVIVQAGQSDRSTPDDLEQHLRARAATAR